MDDLIPFDDPYADDVANFEIGYGIGSTSYNSPIDEPTATFSKPKPSTSSGSKNKTATCKRCGKDGLKWKHTEHGWRLFLPNGIMHTCHKDPEYTGMDIPVPVDLMRRLLCNDLTFEEWLKIRKELKGLAKPYGI